jgi:hypothetical protein
VLADIVDTAVVDRVFGFVEPELAMLLVQSKEKLGAQTL